MIDIRGTGRAYKEGSHMRIEVYPEYSEGVNRIGNRKDLYLLYWADRIVERKRLKVHPQVNMNKPLAGVFTFRSPMRPNPIGMTRVELLKRKGSNLYVAGLDVFSGSPVIEIKSG